MRRGKNEKPKKNCQLREAVGSRDHVIGKGKRLREVAIFAVLRRISKT